MTETISDKQTTVPKFELPEQMRYVPRRKNRSLVIFQWAVILIAGSGFIFKFIEFTSSIFKDDNDLVQFAVTPIAIYSCVAIGFFLMFMWTVVRGDYKDIEKPKFRLFEREIELGDSDLLDSQKPVDAIRNMISMPISKN